VEELTALANAQLERVKVLCSQTGFTYVDLPSELVGVGVAIGFGQNDYVVLSVMGGGSESHLMITSGILNDIAQNRVDALSAANYFTQSNSGLPVFLHDATVGWALILQVTLPIEVLLDVPAYFSALVRGMPGVVSEYRATVAERWELGGQPWTWTPEDHKSLLIRSMM
jgi:hypothetical protein